MKVECTPMLFRLPPCYSRFWGDRDSWMAGKDSGTGLACHIMKARRKVPTQTFCSARVNCPALSPTAERSYDMPSTMNTSTTPSNANASNANPSSTSDAPATSNAATSGVPATSGAPATARRCDSGDQDPPHRPESHSNICNARHYATSIGIDTITVIIGSCTVSSETPLTVSERSDAATGETDNGPLYRIGGDGRLVEGTCAYYNGDDFQITIQGPDSLYVQASLPKLIRPDNIKPITGPDELRQCFSVLENKLEGIGIGADLLGGKISRIDICRNIVTDSPLSSYLRALQEVTFPRTDRHSWNGTNVQWDNTYRQLLFYDKGDREGLDTDRLQRFEYRLMKAKGVRQHVGPETPSELMSSFGATREAFRAAAEKLLPDPSSMESPSTDPSSMERDASTEREASELSRKGIEAVLTALEDHSTQVSDALHAIALRYLRGQGGLDSFRRALREKKGRQAARRYREKFEKLGPVADLLSKKETTATQMKIELREKLLA